MECCFIDACRRLVQRARRHPFLVFGNFVLDKSFMVHFYQSCRGAGSTLMIPRCFLVQVMSKLPLLTRSLMENIKFTFLLGIFIHIADCEFDVFDRNLLNNTVRNKNKSLFTVNRVPKVFASVRTAAATIKLQKTKVTNNTYI